MISDEATISIFSRSNVVNFREARTPLDKDENKITILESNRRMAYIRAFGFKFKIDVDSCDKIKQVKHKIKEAHGPDVDEQELYLGGLRLENEKTVSDYKIEENGEIKLLRIVVGGFQICIKNIRGKEITLQVRSTYTIKKVKELIFEKEGMEVDTQRLIFNVDYTAVLI
ncbi:unnamed protein product [Rhizophagus irregularis]|nr:unnamed protein product [Rhizophagus irregularis]